MTEISVTVAVSAASGCNLSSNQFGCGGFRAIHQLRRLPRFSAWIVPRHHQVQSVYFLGVCMRVGSESVNAEKNEKCLFFSFLFLGFAPLIPTGAMLF